MKRDQQHKMILALREYVQKMKMEDREAFAMMLKRDRDDEDLDSIALQRLNGLYALYVTKKSRESLDAQWKKLTGE